MSNFSDVVTMNELFDNPKGDVKNPEWDGLISMYADLISEELEEVHNAITNRDMKELIDGILDVLVVTYGLSHVTGIDADEGMKRVFDSNMSKLCLTFDDAKKTQEMYQKNHGIKTWIREKTFNFKNVWIVKVDGDQYSKDGKLYPDNKFLKCVTSYKPPKLDDLTG
jgi:NTP pyrophosphatase (non-canonical NTP hydrolase)